MLPSPWVRRFAALIRAGGRVLDVACGSGRHTRLLADAGFHVTALDRDREATQSLASLPGVRVLIADIESQSWPLEGERFDAVVVTNYLHRPLFASLLTAVDDAGLLIYETFARGNERYGRPTNPDFLLEPGELLVRVAPLRVLAYEDLYVDSPKPALVQRICAIRSDVVPQPSTC
ncbi:MAG TPA: class I SAM-dependent methyltransferase [Burkholderiales bacterium]|nr:class I SAM-dependent methyltransferase [Burkholderiales bacterium]